MLNDYYWLLVNNILGCRYSCRYWVSQSALVVNQWLGCPNPCHTSLRACFVVACPRHLCFWYSISLVGKSSNGFVVPLLFFVKLDLNLLVDL